ncbi:MAG: phenylacetate--CoA ligase family protein [Bacillota bacterium]|jgi:phenylacetate-CoA ligase
MMYWNKEMECMPRAVLEQLQWQRLREILQYTYKKVTPFRLKMQKKGLIPEDIKGLADLHKLPFTFKQDLRDNYPYASLAVPLEQIVRIHASSGTTGKPTVVAYTQEDIDTWSEMVARNIYCVGGGIQDVIQVSYGYGLFTGGLGLHYGAEKVGATVIPTSGGNTKKQVMLMRDLGSTILCSTPSYALYLSEVLQQEGISSQELKLKYGIFGAEPWTDSMRRQIEERLGIEAYDIYGLSEIYGPGVGISCPAKAGLHIFEDIVLPEIINPETGEVLPDGTVGELVLTCLTKKGLPMIRYRTRDLTYLQHEKCACGRTHVRMGKIIGRSDDMLIIRGVNIFPSQIESVLLDVDGVSPHYHLVIDKVNNLDTLEVKVEIFEDLFADEVRLLENLHHKIKKEIEAVIGLSCKVTLVEPQTLERTAGKAVRVTDNRQKDKA